MGEQEWERSEEMSVEMKLGVWRARDGTTHVIDQYDDFWIESSNGHWWNNKGQFHCKDDEGGDMWDLVRYLGPLELSPTPACTEARPACDQAESAKKTLAMMRHEYNALDRWLSAYKALVAQNERAKDDLDEAIKRLEKEVEG